MRHVLRLLGSRYGMAIGLLVLIALVVGGGKLIRGGGTSQPLIVTGSPAAIAPTVSELPDDGLTSPGATPGPSTSAGAPGPTTIASDFANAWLNHATVTADQWYKAVTKYATTNLAGKLKQVDPAGVPADKITGDVALIFHSPSYVDAQVPADGGVITLRLLATSGRWLVDGVDWQRS
jgi:hypothetical protein